MEKKQMKIIECPRDAMQGLNDFIPTKSKIRYINKLLSVGFDTIDFGSFVSPKFIPQMRDTSEVLAGLNLTHTKSKLLAIVPNYYGAKQACQFPEIDYLGYPLSVSETFQLRNTHQTISESFKIIPEIQALCLQTNKQLVVYLSMGFGNPYGDVYNPEILEQFTKKLDKIGIKIIQLSDTIGVSVPSLIRHVFETLISKFPHIEFGAHFHASPDSANEKITSALQAGCRRFDGAIGGYGGCPMARDKLVNNVATERLSEWFADENMTLELNFEALSECIQISHEIFP